MGEVIVITSGKGGVGKTTTTANIGIGLSSAGKKVLVIDTDLGLRNLDVVLGLENRIVYNLVDVIESKCRLKQAVIKDTRFENLYLLPSAQTKDKTSVSPEQMKKLIDELKDDYDFILLDCPAGIEQGFKNAIAGAQRSIVVTTPEVSSIRDADRIIGLLEASGIRKNELLINRLRVDMVRRGDMMSVEDVTEILAIDLLGVIPDDESVCIRHVADGGETVNFPVDCRSLDKVSLYVQKPRGMLLHHFLIETHDFVGGDIGRECRPCRSVVQVQLLPAGNHKIDLLIVVCPRHRKQFHTRTDLLLHQLVQVFLHQIPVRLLHPHIECVYNRIRLFAVRPDR